jgi:hypothetical protein
MRPASSKAILGDNMKGSTSSGEGQAAKGAPLSDYPTPQTSSTLICLMASAWQRIFELQCQTAVGALASSQRLGGRPALPDGQISLRYALGVLEVCRHSSESMFGLLRAQVLGEHAELEALNEAALRDFAMTSSDAAQAARDARAALLSGMQSLPVFPTSND